MKNFIITTGAVILILTFMNLQLQCNQLLREKQQLKYVADDAAAAASLCFSEKSFGEGQLYFDRKKAVKKAEQIIGFNLKKKELMWKISFTDQQIRCPYVTVTIERGKLKAISKYEYVPY